jgi:folate-dependent phosphoribosylglycinamide formyltransferase PurN
MYAIKDNIIKKYGMQKLRIAIISNDDKLWSLYAWNNVLNSGLLKQEYDLVGLWTCDQKFGNKKNMQVRRWYLNTFRFWNFFKLFLFTVSFKAFAFIKALSGSYHISFAGLCKAHHIPYYKTALPNDPAFIKWLKENNIDILIIMVDHILKKEVLNAPNICVVNKHASLLPTNRGLYPYLWAKIANDLHGISFHKVNEAIDKGDLYYQETVDHPQLIRSMIKFYFYVHSNYYKMLGIALRNISGGHIIPQNEHLPSNYHSLPTLEDYSRFKKNGGKIINWKDIFLPVNLFKKV